MPRNSEEKDDVVWNKIRAKSAWRVDDGEDYKKNMGPLRYNKGKRCD